MSISSNNKNNDLPICRNCCFFLPTQLIALVVEMREQKAAVQPQPLLFMVHGVDHPFNTRADRSKIARHLSKRYHRQKRKPLYGKSPEPQAKVVQYPVSYYHGGQRLGLDSQAPATKKRKLAIKREEIDESVLTRTQPAEERSAEKLDESEESKPCRDCRCDLIDHAHAAQNMRAMTSPKRPPAHCYDVVPNSKYLQKGAQHLVHLPTSGGWRVDPFQSIPIVSEGCVPVIVDFCKHIGPFSSTHY